MYVERESNLRKRDSAVDIVGGGSEAGANVGGSNFFMDKAGQGLRFFVEHPDQKEEKGFLWQITGYNNDVDLVEIKRQLPSSRFIVTETVNAKSIVKFEVVRSKKTDSE